MVSVLGLSDLCWGHTRWYAFSCCVCDCCAPLCALCNLLTGQTGGSQGLLSSSLTVMVLRVHLVLTSLLVLTKQHSLQQAQHQQRRRLVDPPLAKHSGGDKPMCGAPSVRFSPLSCIEFRAPWGATCTTSWGCLHNAHNTRQLRLYGLGTGQWAWVTLVHGPDFTRERVTVLKVATG